MTIELTEQELIEAVAAFLTKRRISSKQFHGENKFEII